MVEALRAGWSGGDAAPLSPRVQAVIEARLAQLSEPARELVGVAATVGREFTADLLARADERRRGRRSSAAWTSCGGGGIVADQGPDAYDFSHGKIREVAYRALSPPRAPPLHLRVAEALEGCTLTTRRR